jgi:peptidoglycan/xylan/chitin deacetylase (PgdA/CDA1 family)
MRASGAAAVILCASLWLAAPGPAQAAETCSNANSLGVSRTVEIDTSAGNTFGEPYGTYDFLKDHEVVLTFDDGPLRAHTQAVLDALDAQCTKATFFLVGKMAISDPNMVKEIARHGHTIGSHTWSHANLAHLSAARAEAEIEMGFSAVQYALGKEIAPFFRYPYLAATHKLAAYLRDRQVSSFFIDVDSKDYRTKSGAGVLARVMSQLERRHKGILLFHDIQISTSRALPSVLSALKAGGYKVVHIRPASTLKMVAEFRPPAHKTPRRRAITVVHRPASIYRASGPCTDCVGGYRFP